jgi:hypothetical protein
LLRCKDWSVVQTGTPSTQRAQRPSPVRGDFQPGAIGNELNVASFIGQEQVLLPHLIEQPTEYLFVGVAVPIVLPDRD